MSSHAHQSTHPEVTQNLVGITRDPVLRPVGAIMVVVGAIWGLFIGMATEAGTFKEPLAAGALVVVGIVLAGMGKEAEQI